MSILTLPKGTKVIIKHGSGNVEGETLSISTNYGKDGGWYMELVDTKGNYRYWKQDQDGGTLAAINGKGVKNNGTEQ